VSTGEPVPDGNGLREQVTAIAMAWPSVAAARRYARGLSRQLRRYRGEYYLPLKMTGPRRYTPGDRGQGELQRVTYTGWHGIGLRRRFFHYFDHYETSGRVQGGRFVMRRGRYVVDVEWVARTQATDRRLTHLPRRLLQQLA
jgi:hypothetical protein